MVKENNVFMAAVADWNTFVFAPEEEKELAVEGHYEAVILSMLKSLTCICQLYGQKAGKGFLKYD